MLLTYNTADSVMMISENEKLPDAVTAKNTCSIASDLAGEIPSKSFNLSRLQLQIRLKWECD